MKNITIRFNEVSTSISVMKEVAAWGREQGYRIWPDEWLTPEELITSDAQPENFCIGTIDNDVICAFILQWADSDYWPNAPKYEAAYLHKFCVRRKYAGMGITKLVVHAVKAECRKRGIRYIRLDTGLDEKAVRKIYLNAGFKIVDIIDYPNGRSMALYELEVTDDRLQNSLCSRGSVGMDIQKLSSQYTVRDLHPEDAVTVYEALKHNTIFYQYHPPMVTVESIIEDMKALPPDKSYADKHFIGFFRNASLVAVMDLIENYPHTGTALIGFFAINTDLQGNGIGTAIISDSISYLAQLGFEKVRLGIDKGNPQSKAFWTKNGFELTKEEFPNDFSPYLVMERRL